MTSRWTNEYLDRSRRVGDPEADAVVASLVSEGGLDAGRAVFRTLVKNTQPARGSLPPGADHYLTSEAVLPPWTNPELLKQGEDVFAKYGMEICLCLLCGSLPLGYGAVHVAHLLHMTGRLETDARRRVFETAQMLFDVFGGDGLGPEGAGIRTIQRIRLMHGGVRQLILDAAEKDPAVWSSSWGVPLNQEDLAATLLTFTTVVFDGLERLGVKLSDRERDGYFHSWLVVGSLLGIEDNMLPRDVADAEALWERQMQRQIRRSVAGDHLTAALVGVMRGLAPGRALRSMPNAMICHLIGDEHAALVGVARPKPFMSWLFRLVLRAERAAERETRHHHKLLGFSGDFKTALLRGLVVHERGHERPTFDIPDHLAQQWDLADASSPAGQ
ncbi:MAG: oxygenase MpaB family protein [Dehalococcoidia bacterium]